MKGTPFYTGEYENRKGAPEDRVNMWPLVYYRDPALSVLWPFIEKTDEHFALRPLMSINGLDEEARVYNLLWPLGEINQKTGERRFFPVFWSKDYFNIFPLFWHYGGSGARVDSLFPAWVIYRNGEKSSYHFLWPIVNFKNWGRETGWRVWPIAGHYENYGREYSFFAWPLGHAWKNAEQKAGSTLIPLYWYGRDGDRSLFVSLPYSGGKTKNSSWSLVPPLYYAAEDKTKKTLITPLYAKGTALKGDAYWSALVPFYYRDGDRTSSRCVTPVAAWTRKGDAGSWLVYPLLSGGKYREGSGEMWLAGPVYHSKWDKDGAQRHLLPLYYRDTRNGTFVSLPYSSWKTDGGRRAYTVPALLSGMVVGEKRKDFWGAAGLVHASWGEGETPHHVFPLYYRNAGKNQFYSLPYCSVGKGDDIYRVVPPLLSSFTRNGANRDLIILLGLSAHSWNEEGSSGYTIPLYTYGKNYFYTPVVGWKKSETDGFVYPLTPLLGVRTGKDKGGWLFPLFSYRKTEEDKLSGTYLWGRFNRNDRESASSLFPVYSYKNHGPIDAMGAQAKAYSVAGKEFWSLPFCWYRNKVQSWPVYEKGSRTDETRRMIEKGNGFFPLWSYSSTKNMETGRIDSSGGLLFWLFDSKYEKYPERDHEYARKRILWRVYHYEKLNGDVSVDMFPFITYDKKKDGKKHFSFMWRVFSYQKKDDGLKVHVLFIPFGKGK